MPLENILEILFIRFKFLRGAPNSGLCNALTFFTIRSQKHFLLQKKRKNWKIEVSEPWKPIECSKLLSILVKTLSLQRPLKLFLEVKHICQRYLRGAPDSGVYNAPARVVIRHQNRFLLQEKRIFSKFRGSEPWKQVEISEFLPDFDAFFDFRDP